VLPEQRQQDIYNQEEMHEKLEEIMWEGASFADTRATTSAVEEEVKDIEDDLQRELVFYNQVGTEPGCRIPVALLYIYQRSIPSFVH
jgi:hypothetical protein